MDYFHTGDRVKFKFSKYRIPSPYYPMENTVYECKGTVIQVRTSKVSNVDIYTVEWDNGFLSSNYGNEIMLVKENLNFKSIW